MSFHARSDALIELLEAHTVLDPRCVDTVVIDRGQVITAPGVLRQVSVR